MLDMMKQAFIVRPVKIEREALLEASRKLPFEGDREFFCLPPGNAEGSAAPTLRECRYAALQLGNKGYVVYDRLLSRIVDGVYYGPLARKNALGVAQLYSDGYGLPDMSPNGDALTRSSTGEREGCPQSNAFTYESGWLTVN